MYKFWYDNVKSKYGENTKHCYMDTDSFIVHAKADDIWKDIEEDVETRFDTSNFEIDRPLPKGKNKKVIRLMKHELGGQIMETFVEWRAHLEDNNDEDNKVKVTKKCVIKRKPKFKVYQNCLNAAQFENKINYLEKSKTEVDSLKEDQKGLIKNNNLLLKTQQRFRIEKHNVFTEEINKIASCSINDKRMQWIDSIETYAYGMNKNLVCKKKKLNVMI